MAKVQVPVPRSGDEQDARYLRRAIALATASARTIGGPFGALVVRAGKVLGEGTNRVTATQDPTAHAEVVAIRRACHRLHAFDLTDAVLYASAEPCPLCYSAAMWARLARVVYAATRADAAAAGFDDEVFYRELTLPPVQRAVPVTRLVVPGSTAPFEAWRANPDRISY